MKSLFWAVRAATTTPAPPPTQGRQSPTVVVTGLDNSGRAPTVTASAALRVSAVWACVRLIAETVATLPLSVYRRLPDGSRETAREFRLHGVISSSPNADMTAVSFWEAVYASMLLDGNAYIKIHKGNAGETVSLEFLLPGTVTYNKKNKTYSVTKDGNVSTLSRNQMMHIPAFSLDGIDGLSAIRYGAMTISSAIDADKAARSSFNRGLAPVVAFLVNRKLTRDQREEFRDYVETQLVGPMNAGRSPVLEEGVTAQTIGIDPRDAQLLESRSWSVEDVCRLFRVPPWMIGHTEKSTSWGSGMEEQMIGFLTFTLMPWMERVEQAINKHLLTTAQQQTYYAEYSVEGLLRADSAARAEFYAKMTSNGIYTRDDCRVRENLPRRGGNADELTVQVNMTTIDSIGKNNAEQAARTALNTWLNED